MNIPSYIPVRGCFSCTRQPISPKVQRLLISRSQNRRLRRLMDRHEQRCAIKFLLLQGKRHKAVHRERTTVLAKETVSIETVKHWCRRFKDGDFSVAGHERPGRPPSGLSNVIIRYLNDEPFLSARALPKCLATDHQAIKAVLGRDMGLRQFTRRWVPHKLTIDQN
jgi:hypothetical protein